MNELAQLQKQLQHFILTGTSDISHSVLASEAVSTEKRLNIYRDAYVFRLIECLIANFPALHSYLGTEEFHALCRNFINTHPSHYRSIRWYGDALAQFVKKYYTQRYAFLAELAEFEWKMTLAFDAQDAPAVTVDEMAAIAPQAWGGLKFSIHPSVQQVNCCWNTIHLWQALTADQTLPILSEAAVAKTWIIWRNQKYSIQFYSISPEEAWLLDGVKDGLTFADLCDGLCQWIEVDRVALSAASYLKNWITKGMLSQLYV